MSGPLAVLVLAVAASDPEASRPLARYRGGEVTAQEFARWLAAEGLEDDPGQRRANLESAALGESLVAAALAAGTDRDPAVRFQLDEAERGILAQAHQRQESLAVVVSDAEVEAELEAEEALLVKPRRARLRNIFKRVPPGAGPAERAAARARMEELRRLLSEGADFAELALAESDSQTRFQGGVMGAVPVGALQPEVERIAFGLGAGELSPVIETAEGFTLLRCEGIVEGRVMPRDEARRTIREGLRRRRDEARQQALRLELSREASLEDLGGGPDAPAVVARFRGGQLTASELGWLAGPGSDPLAPERRRALLEDHVVRVMMAERARQQGLAADPAVSLRLSRARARTLATAEMARRVTQVLVRPTPAEIEAHFDANRDRYQRPPEMDFSVIRLPLDAGTEPRRLQEGAALVAGLRSGQRDFAEAARASSRHASAPLGGRLGWRTAREAAPLGPNVLRALSTAAPGEVVGPVQQDDALWIVKLWERRPARPLTLEEARQRVEQELGSARVAELQRRLQDEAREALELRVTEP